MRLNASARKTIPKRSENVKVRPTLRLELVSPGPRIECSPAVPKRHTARFEVEQLDPDTAFWVVAGKFQKAFRMFCFGFGFISHMHPTHRYSANSRARKSAPDLSERMAAQSSLTAVAAALFRTGVTTDRFSS